MHEPTDRDAEIAALLPSVYKELRRIANAHLARMPSGSTLQPTALVHEAWLRLGGSEKSDWKGRAHFLAAAAGGLWQRWSPNPMLSRTKANPWDCSARREAASEAHAAIDPTGLARRRAPGGDPTTRLNARANAASER